MASDSLLDSYGVAGGSSTASSVGSPTTRRIRVLTGLDGIGSGVPAVPGPVTPPLVIGTSSPTRSRTERFAAFGEQALDGCGT
ncbi:hypothetical protein GCM10010405_51340 [Streptomyces macrosporus]|uniref:Uncharacterized protein n=1 Tax=Streptomyces macrosporus TaxID=44032 RepID=A0ABP5XUC1_9ACTN